MPVQATRGDRDVDLGDSDGALEQTRTADRVLTMQVLYLLSYEGPDSFRPRRPGPGRPRLPRADPFSKLERETGLEPATLSLEG